MPRLTKSIECGIFIGHASNTGGDMEMFRGLDLRGASIVEHRSDKLIAGRIAYAGLNGDYSIGIHWTDDDGFSRTTLFSARSWLPTRIDNVMLLRREAMDRFDICDMPHRKASLYVIIMPV